ncbi:hypothetical protein BD779DRAFT_1664581 [Infundibulicybe gibba]|nr:hypothetical protein BD779DRAFT_1664581 [Infundibulicybe gibba]
MNYPLVVAPAKPHRVLLLLDVQTFLLSPHPSAPGRTSPPLIIHVRNTGDPGDPDAPHTPGWNLMFPPLLHEVILDKRKNNAFAGTHLADIIPPTPSSAALGRGNEVLLIRGAHATFDRIEVLHGGGVTPAERIEDEIEAELEEAGVHLLDMKDLPGIFVDR